MAEPWKMPPPAKVLEAIEVWRTLDLRSATDREVDDAVRTFLDTIEYFAATGLKISGLKTVYRARFALRGERQLGNPWPWTSVSELLYPPPECAPRQRCNVPNHPVMYCARDVITCLREMRANEGDQVVLARYQVRDASLAVVVPKAKTDSIDGQPIFDADGEISFLILREFVRTEFTKPVGIGTEFLYKISSSLCGVLFDAPNNDGWVYPSVESSEHDCLAFKTGFVDSDDFRICEAGLFDVLAEHDRCFAIRRREAATIGDGDVTWQPKQGDVRWVTPKREPGDPPLVLPLPDEPPTT